MCMHQSCGAEKFIWLPVTIEEKGDIMPHPWCTRCGVVKNISQSKGKKMGYWMNLLANIVRRFAISQAQKRLIAKELQAYDGFDDVYAITFAAQQRIFTDIINRHCKLSKNIVNSMY